MSTEAVAFERLAAGLLQRGPSEADAKLQRGIDATMREVIADRHYSPVMREASPVVRVEGAGPVVDCVPKAREGKGNE